MQDQPFNFFIIIILVVKNLSTVRTSIVSIPNRYPVETIVVQPKNPTKILPLITSPHGGPHSPNSVTFSPTTTALVLEGCESTEGENLIKINIFALRHCFVTWLHWFVGIWRWIRATFSRPRKLWQT